MAISARSLNKNCKFLIFGGGYSGKYLANEIRKLGCIALTSSRSKANNENSFFFDSFSNELPQENIFSGTTHIISCIPPTKRGEDPVLSRLEKKLEQLSLEWVGYLSTTGVYGNTDGNWVSEKDPVKPLQERSKRRRICELKWINANLPTQIFRLPGIYGPGRSTIESILKKNIKVINKKAQIFSRIHVSDIANSIIYLLNNKKKLDFHPIINIADNYPCSQVEVIKYSYELLRLEMPQPIEFKEAEKILSPIALSFWEENRKVSNNLLCNKLGYKLLHKDYKSGLKSCLESISNHNNDNYG